VRKFEDMEEIVNEAMYGRCETFFEDLLRMVQLCVSWLESWVKEDGILDNFLLILFSFVGKVRCRIYGHKHVLDQTNQVIVCACCLNVKEYG